jgi:hypothetical protein
MRFTVVLGLIISWFYFVPSGWVVSGFEFGTFSIRSRRGNHRTGLLEANWENEKKWATENNQNYQNIKVWNGTELILTHETALYSQESCTVTWNSSSDDLHFHRADRTLHCQQHGVSWQLLHCAFLWLWHGNKDPEQTVNSSQTFQFWMLITMHQLFNWIILIVSYSVRSELSVNWTQNKQWWCDIAPPAGSNKQQVYITESFVAQMMP